MPPASSPGGFFVTVANEYDPRPGRIRDEIAAGIARWIQHLQGPIADAVEPGQLSSCDAAQLAFEIEALLVAGNHVYHLNDGWLDVGAPPAKTGQWEGRLVAP